MMKTNVQTNIGCIFNELLQRLESPGEFKIPEWLKKDSMSYTLIRRNIYLTKKVKARAEDDGMFCSCNPAMGSRGVCDRDCFCGMLFSSCSHSCKCGSACLNKPFQHRTMKRMKMIETERCGFGLVADEDIKQGEFVIEYVGEVINDKICEERLWKMKHRGETNFYLCEINRDTVIDATYKGNKSRFINHSCQPNTEMQKWRIDGETRIGIFAIRDIKKGEELTYDYQFVQFGADQNCYCGATVCRGKLGSKPTKDLLNGRSYSGTVHLSDSHQAKPFLQNCIEQIVRIWCPQDKSIFRYYGGVILSFNNSSKEHTILKEDGHLIILDLSKEEWNFL